MRTCISIILVVSILAEYGVGTPGSRIRIILFIQYMHIALATTSTAHSHSRVLSFFPSHSLTRQRLRFVRGVRFANLSCRVAL